jgi:hypothetical protein
MQQCSFTSLCWTKDLWPDYPQAQNVVWNTWFWIIHATLASAIQRDWLSCKMISSTAGLKSFLHSHLIHSFYPPSGFPPWSLVLTQNTPDYTDARHCNPIPSSLIFTLLNMHPHSKARIPPAIIIPQHQPFINPLQNCLAKLLAQRKDFQQQAKFYKNRPLHLSI